MPYKRVSTTFVYAPSDDVMNLPSRERNEFPPLARVLNLQDPRLLEEVGDLSKLAPQSWCSGQLVTDRWSPVNSH